MNIQRFLWQLEQQPSRVVLALSLALVGLLGLIDLATGYEVSFSIFYLLPVSMVSWVVTRRAGLWLSALSAGVWLFADLAAGHAYSHPLIPIWNASVRLGFFLIVALILSSLKDQLTRESELARKDFLTGLPNSRFFHELTQQELEHASAFGHPLTLVYVEASGLGWINDRFGYQAGDQVLLAIAEVLSTSASKRMVAGRLGGALFALLIPETDPATTRASLEKLQSRLGAEVGKKYGQPMRLLVAGVWLATAQQTASHLMHQVETALRQLKEEKNTVLKLEMISA